MTDELEIRVLLAELSTDMKSVKEDVGEIKIQTRLTNGRVNTQEVRLVRLEEQMKKQMDDSSRRSNILPGVAIGVMGLLIAIVNIVVLFPHG